ncbi:hypothetical protein PPROV_000256100 [Pycnococcus provasolii]|uniref:Uncharacterized protein n=1 Tax=Pycnococcus provasolii TaxID=41880 RepID=A0A830HFC2_9CHLO|nr:hypothetical protein PPROV_000256100 [Pycnococcus provasolii]
MKTMLNACPVILVLSVLAFVASHAPLTAVSAARVIEADNVIESSSSPAGLAAEGKQCTKESFAKMFGALYKINVEDGGEPRWAEGVVTVSVEYQTPCVNGGSEFRLVRKEAPGADNNAQALYVLLHRSEPVCEGEEQDTIAYKGTVEAVVPDDLSIAMANAGGRAYLAFPPDSEYELYLLEDESSANEASPLF